MLPCGASPRNCNCSCRSSLKVLLGAVRPSPARTLSAPCTVLGWRASAGCGAPRLYLPRPEDGLEACASACQYRSSVLFMKLPSSSRAAAPTRVELLPKQKERLVYHSVGELQEQRLLPYRRVAALRRGVQ